MRDVDGCVAWDGCRCSECVYVEGGVSYCVVSLVARSTGEHMIINKHTCSERTMGTRPVYK